MIRTCEIRVCALVLLLCSMVPLLARAGDDAPCQKGAVKGREFLCYRYRYFGEERIPSCGGCAVLDISASPMQAGGKVDEGGGGRQWRRGGGVDGDGGGFGFQDGRVSALAGIYKALATSSGPTQAPSLKSERDSLSLKPLLTFRKQRLRVLVPERVPVTTRSSAHAGGGGPLRTRDPLYQLLQARTFGLGSQVFNLGVDIKEAIVKTVDSEKIFLYKQGILRYSTTSPSHVDMKQMFMPEDRHTTQTEASIYSRFMIFLYNRLQLDDLTFETIERAQAAFPKSFSSLSWNVGLLRYADTSTIHTRKLCHEQAMRASSDIQDSAPLQHSLSLLGDHFSVLLSIREQSAISTLYGLSNMIFTTPVAFRETTSRSSPLNDKQDNWGTFVWNTGNTGFVPGAWDLVSSITLMHIPSSLLLLSEGTSSGLNSTLQRLLESTGNPLHPQLCKVNNTVLLNKTAQDDTEGSDNGRDFNSGAGSSCSQSSPFVYYFKGQRGGQSLEMSYQAFMVFQAVNYHILYATALQIRAQALAKLSVNVGKLLELKEDLEGMAEVMLYANERHYMETNVLKMPSFESDGHHTKLSPTQDISRIKEASTTLLHSSVMNLLSIEFQVVLETLRKLTAITVTRLGKSGSFTKSFWGGLEQLQVGQVQSDGRPNFGSINNWMYFYSTHMPRHSEIYLEKLKASCGKDANNQNAGLDTLEISLRLTLLPEKYPLFFEAINSGSCSQNACPHLSFLITEDILKDLGVPAFFSSVSPRVLSSSVNFVLQQPNKSNSTSQESRDGVLPFYIDSKAIARISGDIDAIFTTDSPSDFIDINLLQTMTDIHRLRQFSKRRWTDGVFPPETVDLETVNSERDMTDFEDVAFFAGIEDDMLSPLIKAGDSSTYKQFQHPCTLIASVRASMASRNNRLEAPRAFYGEVEKENVMLQDVLAKVEEARQKVKDTAVSGKINFVVTASPVTVFRHTARPKSKLERVTQSSLPRIPDRLNTMFIARLDRVRPRAFVQNRWRGKLNTGLDSFFTDVARELSDKFDSSESSQKNLVKAGSWARNTRNTSLELISTDSSLLMQARSKQSIDDYLMLPFLYNLYSLKVDSENGLAIPFVQFLTKQYVSAVQVTFRLQFHLETLEHKAEVKDFISNPFAYASWMQFYKNDGIPPFRAELGKCSGGKDIMAGNCFFKPFYSAIYHSD
eukprot:Nk52_evm5s151 gene=Nk52_evmTU5s151